MLGIHHLTGGSSVNVTLVLFGLWFREDGGVRGALGSAVSVSVLNGLAVNANVTAGGMSELGPV